jgi:hypothetical protein
MMAREPRTEPARLATNKPRAVLIDAASAQNQTLGKRLVRRGHSNEASATDPKGSFFALPRNGSPGSNSA